MKRAYEQPGPDDGWRVLVDRVWPRGMTREALRLDERRPDLAPSTALRRRFGHDPGRWDEFRERYREELARPAASAALDELAERARTGRVTLVYSARDEAHNQARVLAELIEERLASPDPKSDEPYASGDGPGPRDDKPPRSAGANRDAARGRTGGAARPARRSAEDGSTEASDAGAIEALERLIRAGVAVTTQALAERHGEDLTLQQWRVLVLVAAAGGLRVGAIATRIRQSVPSASRLVGRLEERGMVTVEADPGDGRAVVVRASSDGRRVVRAVLAARRRLIANALAASGRPLPRGTTPVVQALARALDHLV